MNTTGRKKKSPTAVFGSPSTGKKLSMLPHSPGCHSLFWLEKARKKERRNNQTLSNELNLQHNFLMKEAMQVKRSRARSPGLFMGALFPESFTLAGPCEKGEGAMRENPPPSQSLITFLFSLSSSSATKYEPGCTNNTSFLE